MHESDQEILDRLAAAVSDGTPVDWDRELEERPHLAREIESLRALSLVRRSHSDDETETSGTLGPNDRPADRGEPLFRWGPLDVLEQIGEGSFGEVYRAFDPLLQTHFALKLRKLRPDEPLEAVDRFIDEARLLARVHHPNVLTVHGAAVHDGRVGIWTDLIQGETLERHLTARGPLGPREVVGIGADLCRALASVHGAGLLHRDVKTSNAMREAGGRIVLMDFGSGTNLPAAGALHESTHVHGTLLFMAPEQLSGTIAGPPTDIYSLGVVLYRLLTRGFPVEANTIPELIEGHRRGPIPLRDRRPELPPGLVHVIHKSLAPDPQGRYPTAGTLELALVRSLDDGPSTATLEAVRRRRRRKRLQRLAWATAGLVVIALAAVLAWRFGRQPERIALAPPSPLTASATLLRETATGDQPLLPGARIRKGDRLAMAIQGSDSMHVYVLDQDEVGNVFVLFPLPGLNLANPLSPGVRHRLPGATRDSTYSWAVTIEGKRETVFALASREPLQSLEQEIESVPRARPGQAIPLDRLAVLRLRGIGGVEATRTEGVEGSASASETFDLAGTLERTMQSSRVWFWSTTLENPPSPH